MSWQFNLFAMLMWIEAAALLVLARIVWKRRSSVSEQAFTALLLAQVIWLATYGLELEGANLATVHFWAQITYLGIVFVPICFFLFAAAYTESYPKLFQGRLVLFTFVPSLITLLVIWTNDWHHLYWTSYRLNTTAGPFPYHQTTPGPWFWLFIAYAYTVTGWAALILLRAWHGRAAGIYRRHYLFMLGTWVLALSTSFLWISGVWSLQALDPTPIALGVALVLIYAVPLGSRLFEILPLAREAVVENLPRAVIVLDGNGRIVDLNPAAERLLNVTQAQTMGRVPAALFPQDGQLSGVFASHAESSREIALAVDGQTHYLDVHSSPLYDRLGQDRGRVILLQDVSDRKQSELKLRDNEKVMRALLNASTEVAYLMDVQGDLLAFNQNLCDLVGLPPEEVRGRNAFDLLPQELAESRAVPVGRAISTGQPERWVDLFDERYMDNSVYPVTGDDGRVDRVAFFARDISNYKLAEEQIIRYAEELEARNRDLDAFARTVAHDLKKPLQGIVGFASLIEMDFSTIAPDLKLFIDSILESAENMVEMIDNLLLMARLRDAEEMAEPVELSRVMEAALRRFKQDLAERNFRLTVEEPMPSVVAYGPWLEEVFANLIGNAIKYIGRANPAPAISIRARRVGDQVRCEVQDNGLGITAEDQTHLFQQFKRFHHAEASGTGLGLSIVERIVEKMGGKVGVESTPGEGSTFWFTLPAA